MLHKKTARHNRGGPLLSSQNNTLIGLGYFSVLKRVVLRNVRRRLSGITIFHEFPFDNTDDGRMSRKSRHGFCLITRTFPIKNTNADLHTI